MSVIAGAGRTTVPGGANRVAKLPAALGLGGYDWFTDGGSSPMALAKMLFSSWATGVSAARMRRVVGVGSYVPSACTRGAADPGGAARMCCAGVRATGGTAAVVVGAAVADGPMAAASTAVVAATAAASDHALLAPNSPTTPASTRADTSVEVESSRPLPAALDRWLARTASGSWIVDRPDTNARRACGRRCPWVTGESPGESSGSTLPRCCC
mmetsp:Transcript_18994/g.60489  ORF Transcript_18994/g.60489 Transcript_18994/m.60489 type:complete len:213 (+) Transcript_18994:257-895(+)